jgi:glycerol uptake facilitator-like aquaporin
MVIWGVLDPSNIFVSTTTGPVLIALAYATVIWGYVPATVATNSARDLGVLPTFTWS